MKININRLAVALALIICIAYSPSQAQTPWHGKKAAVVLTYDDAIDQHLDHALPALEANGLKATFYITAGSSSVAKRTDEWKALAAKGHELGNHTLFHPCNGGPGREWVSAEYDMRYYTVKRMQDEMRMTNTFLQSLDGKSSRSFAFTCGDMTIHDTAFMDIMHNDFAAARAVRHEMHTLDNIDIYNMDCYAVNNQSFEEMKAWVDEAMRKQALLVILFHGVGGGNALNVSIENHRKLLAYLRKNEKEIWIAPLIDVAAYIKTAQSGK